MKEPQYVTAREIIDASNLPEDALFLSVNRALHYEPILQDAIEVEYDLANNMADEDGRYVRVR